MTYTGKIKVFQLDDKGRERAVILDVDFNSQKELRKILFFLNGRPVVAKVAFNEYNKSELFPKDVSEKLRVMGESSAVIEMEY